ncbi:uncharacterized protein [Clytia hemisphaerica]|uniref:Mab-21-like HhH/H2TH-like domain-containing protein n=1 Tax=Clytia hemisphaerica TaxID=252671 RepID=A0A7M5X7R9_9CNID
MENAMEEGNTSENTNQRVEDDDAIISVRKERKRSRVSCYLTICLVVLCLSIPLLVLYLLKGGSTESESNANNNASISNTSFIISNSTNNTMNWDEIRRNFFKIDGEMAVTWLLGGFAGLATFILAIPFMACICRNGYYSCSRIFRNRKIQDVTRNITPCIRRKTLPDIINQLYSCVVDTVDRQKVEQHAKTQLYEPLEKACNLVFLDNIELVLAGSVAEKFSLPYYPGYRGFRHGNISDFDFMLSPKNKSASFEQKTGVNYQVISDDPSLCQGFVYLFENDEKLSAIEIKNNIENIVLDIPDDTFEITTRLRDLSVYLSFTYVTSDGCCDSTHITVKNKGPAITIISRYLHSYHFYYDITFSIHCIDWPSQISNWEHRHKKWPGNRDVERIVNHGCHLVPKSPENGDEYAWRLSFSKNEVELSNLIPPVARMCYLAIKSIRKNDLIFAKVPSYLLKSILFYTLENTNPNKWISREDENISTCFHLLLDKIITAFENKSCPHFWIPDINLLDEEAIETYQNKCVVGMKRFFGCKSNYVEQVLGSLRRIKEQPEFYIQPFPTSFLKRFPGTSQSKKYCTNYIEVSQLI